MLFILFFNELKYRGIYCIYFFTLNFFLFLFFSKEILFLLVKPLLLVNSESINFTYFIFTDMADIFFLYIEISFIISIFLTIPKILIQVYIFLIQGLYKYEKNIIIFITVFTISLSFCLTFFLYLYIIPFIWVFFINFELTSNESLFGVYYEPKIKDYITFYIMINKSIILALLFLPNLVFLLVLLKSDFIYVFFKYRKLVILLIFIIGGIFSPPDIFSQLVIAFFLLILYELILGINLLNEIYLDKSKQN